MHQGMPSLSLEMRQQIQPTIHLRQPITISKTMIQPTIVTAAVQVSVLAVVSVMVSHQAMVNITMVSAMVLRMTQTLSHPLQSLLTSLAMPFPYLVLQRQLQPIMLQRLHIITSRTMTPKIMVQLAMDLVVSVMVLVQAMATITMVSAMALEMVPTS